MLEGDAPLPEQRQRLGHGFVDVDKDLLAVVFQFGLVEAFEVDDLRRGEQVSLRSPCAKLGAEQGAGGGRTFICFCRMGDGSASVH